MYRRARIRSAMGTGAMLAVVLAAHGAAAQGVDTVRAAASPREPAADTLALSISQAVRLASDTATPVTLARLGATEAASAVREARAALLPSLTGSAGFVRRTFNSATLGLTLPHAPGTPGLPERVNPFNVWDARAQFAQTLFDPAASARVHAAEKHRDAARAQTASAAQNAELQAALAYITAARAAATVTARQADLHLADELLGIARAQYRAGIGTTLDTVRAAGQAIAARAAIVIAQGQRDQAEIALARVLRLPPGMHFRLRDSLTPALAHSVAPITAHAALDTAMRLRPELRTARATLQSARAARRAIGAERLGHLQLAADYGASGTRQDNMIGTGQFAIQYQIPFFDGGRRAARLDAQGVAEQSAAITLDDLEAQVRADVYAALAAVASADAQHTIAQQQVTLALEELREARLRFVNGVAGNVDIVTAQSNLVRARDALVAADAARAEADARLAHAAGVTLTIGMP